MKPVLVIPGTDYVICFDAEFEDTSMRRHFIGECGWSAEEYEKIADYNWFSANVSLWRSGELLQEEFLGTCCYETEEQFWTIYAGDYFADMVCTLLKDLPDALKWAEQWRRDLRKDHKQ